MKKTPLEELARRVADAEERVPPGAWKHTESGAYYDVVGYAFDVGDDGMDIKIVYAPITCPSVRFTRYLMDFKSKFVQVGD